MSEEAKPSFIDNPTIDYRSTEEDIHSDTFFYRGIGIEGIESVEASGVMKKEDITQLLDKLPQGFVKYVPLDKIVFHPVKYFSIIRDGNIITVPEDEIVPDDEIFRRIRGVMNWNSEMQNGNAIASDGKMTIDIFSTVDWEGEDDREVALYTLAHELGHATWNTLVDAKKYYKDIASRGVSVPKELCPTNFDPLIHAWKALSENQLARYQSYKTIFMEEGARTTAGREKLDVAELAKEEDFAISHEHYLHNQDLASLDAERFDLIDLTYEILNEQ